MSSNIPIRRPAPQRSVRNTVKDIENATSRAARIAARTKALAEGDLKPVAPKKALEPTTDTAAGKRKRGVLAEVAGPNAHKDASGKGKEREKLEETSKANPSSRPLARRPLQTTAGGRIAPSATSTIKTAGLRRKFTVASSEEPSESSAAPAIRRQASVHERVHASTSTSRATSVTDDEESARALKKRHTTPYDDHLPPISEAQVRLIEQSQLDADAVAAELDDEVEEVQDWKDLDGEDADDPLMVAEYATEIYKYIKEIENKSLPNANYIELHEDIDWTKRMVLLDWMLQVHSMYRCLPETWFLFVNLFDRFLSLRATISVSKLQLVGLSCFYVATKFEESVAPSVNDIVKLAGDQYKVSELLKAEQYVLKTVEWNLSFAGPMSFLRRGSKADDLDHNVRMIGKYLLEVASLDWRLVGVPTSMHAAASLYLGRMAMGKEDWGPTLSHYAGYTEQQILPVVNVLIDHLLLPEDEQSITLVKKYASKRYMKCSIFMREWITFVFPAGSPINLEAELPRLKRSVRDERLKMEEATERRRARDEIRAALRERSAR